MICVYKITSPSGRIYIGCTVDYDRRLRIYKSTLAKGQHKLHNSFNKYGFNTHKFEVIEECVKENVFDREKFYIKELDSIKTGLNIHVGGKGGDTWSHSENREIIISKLRDRKGTSNPNYDNNYTHSEQAKRNMRGRRKSIEGGKNPNAKPLICREINRQFNTTAEVAEYFGYTRSKTSHTLKRDNMAINGLQFERLDTSLVCV